MKATLKRKLRFKNAGDFDKGHSFPVSKVMEDWVYAMSGEDRIAIPRSACEITEG
jgi:hypothetical protein